MLAVHLISANRLNLPLFTQAFSSLPGMVIAKILFLNFLHSSSNYSSWKKPIIVKANLISLVFILQCFVTAILKVLDPPMSLAK